MASAEMSRTIQRHAASGLTSCKLGTLRDLARTWQAARACYLRDYWQPSYASRVLRSPRMLREERRRSGWAPIELTVSHHQTALMSALGVLRGSWNLAIKQASLAISRDSGLSEQEKKWSRRVLRDPDLLQRCLDQEAVIVDERWCAALDAQRLSRRIRRLILHVRPGRPRPASRLWLEFDAEMYRPFRRENDRHFRGSWVALTTRRRGERICVPLAGRALLLENVEGVANWPTIRLDVSVRPKFTLRTRTQASLPRSGGEIGVDKGYRTLVTVSDGSPFTARDYGKGSAVLIDEISVSDAERRAQRRRLASYARSIRSQDPQKYRRLKRHNLGARRSQARGRRERATLRNGIDRALNDMFRTESPVRRIFAERLDIRGRMLSRGSNRRLGRWSNGYLHRRLAYKAGLNGVELIVVNAAYTSQTCPRCWFTSGSNRRAERFLCSECGYTGSSDAVAATNVLSRGRDPAFSGFISRSQVKQILDERWRTARSGRAWGSNDHDLLVPDDDQGTGVIGAANNWSPDQSTSAKPTRGAG